MTSLAALGGPFLAGRVAVVTGAARGIGRATAESLAAHGADLVLIDRDTAALEPVAAAVRALERQALPIGLDVRDEAAVADAATRTVAQFGAVHILVNNAGTAIRKPVLDFTLDEWRRVMDVNLTGAFLMCRAFVPHMKGQGFGRVIGLASVMGHVSSAGRGVYSATKHALLGLTKALAAELADDGITCTCVSPGFVATDFTLPLQQSAEFQAELQANALLKRWGTPEEIAQLITYLCSDAAAFITGSDVLIDGGWAAH
jgi:NAD(P)-dependent dehydrogenase (short-subunit alcohol dehydrogenase family)